MSMKMKNFFNLLLSTVFAVLLFASCVREAVDILVIKMSADSGFKDSYASINFTLTKASGSDISISLLVLDQPSEGNSCVAASKLTLPSSVVVSAGSTSVKLDVALAEDAVGTEAVIAVAGVVGASLEGEGVARIKTGQSYSGGGQGGEGGGGGEGGLTLSLQSSWTATILDDDWETDGEYYYYPVSVTAPGSTYIYLDTYSDAELQEEFNGSIEDLLKYYSGIEEGSTVEDSFYTASDVVYVPYYEAGLTKCYIMDFDAKGNPTGKYGVVELNVPDYGDEGGGEGGQGGEETTIPFTGTTTLKSNWTLTIEEVGTDEYGDYILVDVTTDAQLFAVDYYTEAEMIQYFGSVDIADMLTAFQTTAVSASATYTNPSDYFWTQEDDVYCDYYEGYENGTDFYILEFGTDWLATGNYGKVHLNVPVLSNARKAFRVKIAPQHKRTATVRVIAKHRKK